LPHDPLTALDQAAQPTAAAIRLLRQELYGNAIAVKSTLGGGKHGHLGMLMPQAEYTAISHGNTEYINPQEPAVPRYSKNAERREQEKQEYRKQQETYTNEATAQDQLADALRVLILQAVPEVYIADLKCVTTAFGNVSPRALLDHLIDMYGTIKPDDLLENLKKLSTPWDPDTPIETVFNNGNICRQFAEEGKEPITDSMYMLTLLGVFRNSGVLTQAIREWEFKAPGDKTSRAFKVHFKQADEYRRRYDQQLKESIAANTTGRAPPTDSQPTNPSPAALSATDLQTKVSKHVAHPSLAGYGYCWSHGICNHWSGDCQRPEPGHKKEATLKKQMGGSTKVFNVVTFRKEQREAKKRKRAEAAAAAETTADPNST
jgi:hypothetical protein